MKKILLNGLQVTGDGAGICTYINNLTSIFDKGNTGVDFLFRGDSLYRTDNPRYIYYDKNIKNSRDRILAEQILALNLINKYRLVHFPDYAVPIFAKIPCIATIHDLACFSIKEAYTPKQVFVKRMLMSFTVKKAEKIICISEFTAKELKKYFPNINPEKIEVIHNGLSIKKIVNPTPSRNLFDKYKIKKPYILYTGTLAPHKNIVRLIQAFSILKRQGYDYQLVIAGKKGWLYEDIFIETNRLGIQQEVIFTGFVSDEDLEALYKNCEFVSFISLYEGFGLPPLDAMARGKPALVSNVASIPEIVGDAGVYCNPLDVNDILKAMIKIINDKYIRDYIINKGKERIQKFSLNTTAKKTYELYEKVLLNKEKVV